MCSVRKRLVRWRVCIRSPCLTALVQVVSLYVSPLLTLISATTWGKQALMVLCPYVFVLPSQTPPQLLPQPTEVASVHWIPLRALLSPSLRTLEHVDISSRMARQGGPLLRYFLRALMGKMVGPMFRSMLPSRFAHAATPSSPKDAVCLFSYTHGWRWAQMALLLSTRACR